MSPPTALALSMPSAGSLPLVPATLYPISSSIHAALAAPNPGNANDAPKDPIPGSRKSAPNSKNYCSPKDLELNLTPFQLEQLEKSPICDHCAAWRSMRPTDGGGV